MNLHKITLTTGLRNKIKMKWMVRKLGDGSLGDSLYCSTFADI